MRRLAPSARLSNLVSFSASTRGRARASSLHEESSLSVSVLAREGEERGRAGRDRVGGHGTTSSSSLLIFPFQKLALMPHKFKIKAERMIIGGILRRSIAQINLRL